MYVDLNELRIQRECLCSVKKGHPAPSPPCSSPAPPLSSFSIPSFLPLLPHRQPFACPPITHRYKDHTERSHLRHHFDCHLSPPSPVCGGPAEWSSPCRSHCVHFPYFLFSAATVLLFFNMWGRGVLMILLVFFISKMGGGVCESCFSSFRPNKAHPMASCPPSLPLCLSHPSPPLPPAPFVSVCVHCEPLFLLITITVHPPSPPPSW